jgi:hypothetical protein
MNLRGLGGLPPRPQNAPNAADLVPGIQAGAQNAIVLANVVIVFGPTGTISGLFIYNVGTTPAKGNQPLVSATNASTDPFGNPTIGGSVTAYLAEGGGDVSAVSLSAGGIVFSFYNGSTWTTGANIFQSFNVNGSQLQLVADGTTPNAGVYASPILALAFQSALPASGVGGQVLLLDDPAGQLVYMADPTNGDGNTYDTGRLSQALGSNLPISGTGHTAIFSAAVTPGTYRVEGFIECQQGATAAAQVLGFSGPAATCRIQYYYIEQAVTAQEFSQNSNMGSLTTTSSPAYGAGITFTFAFRGVINVTAAGTLEVIGAEGTSGDSFTVINGSFFDLMPVTVSS